MQIDITKNPEILQVDEALIDVVRHVVEKMGQLYDLDDSEVSITLTDDAYIHKVNKKYRNVDRPTDVLSFAFNEGEEPEIEGGPGVNIMGDILISVERAAAQAEEYGHSMRREIAFLTTHGMLHLMGYDHIEEEDRQEMRAEEEFVMENLGISRES